MVNSANQKCSTHKNAAYPSSGSSLGSKYGSSSSGKKQTDPYHASEYDDYEDFYEDYYDDFEGIDDAEDYWNDHN